MIVHAAKIGAIAWLLWGVVHIIGGGVLLSESFAGPNAFLHALTGSEQSTITPSSVEGSSEFGLHATTEVFKFHAFDLFWLGILVSGIAILMNWKNSATGFWLNLTIVGFTDIGLVLFMAGPGVVPISDAWIGPTLFIVALVFSTLARWRPVTG